MDYTTGNDYSQMCCPKCDRHFSNGGDPMDPDDGDEIECSNCGVVLIISEIETVPTFSLTYRDSKPATEKE